MSQKKEERVKPLIVECAVRIKTKEFSSDIRIKSQKALGIFNNLMQAKDSDVEFNLFVPLDSIPTESQEGLVIVPFVTDVFGIKGKLAIEKGNVHMLIDTVGGIEVNDRLVVTYRDELVNLPYRTHEALLKKKPIFKHVNTFACRMGY